MEVLDGPGFAARERGVSFSTIGEETPRFGVNTALLFFGVTVISESDEFSNGPGLLGTGPS